MYKCPDCGNAVMTSGRCFVCYSCGAEGCGVGNLEVTKEDEPNDQSLRIDGALQSKGVSV